MQSKKDILLELIYQEIGLQKSIDHESMDQELTNQKLINQEVEARLTKQINNAAQQQQRKNATMQYPLTNPFLRQQINNAALQQQINNANNISKRLSVIGLDSFIDLPKPKHQPIPSIDPDAKLVIMSPWVNNTKDTYNKLPYTVNNKTKLSHGIAAAISNAKAAKQAGIKTEIVICIDRQEPGYTLLPDVENIHQTIKDCNIKFISFDQLIENCRTRHPDLKASIDILQGIYEAEMENGHPAFAGNAAKVLAPLMGWMFCDMSVNLTGEHITKIAANSNNTLINHGPTGFKLDMEDTVAKNAFQCMVYSMHTWYSRDLTATVDSLKAIAKHSALEAEFHDAAFTKTGMAYKASTPSYILTGNVNDLIQQSQDKKIQSEKEKMEKLWQQPQNEETKIEIEKAAKRIQQYEHENTQIEEEKKRVNDLMQQSQKEDIQNNNTTNWLQSDFDTINRLETTQSETQCNALRPKLTQFFTKHNLQQHNDLITGDISSNKDEIISKLLQAVTPQNINKEDYKRFINQSKEIRNQYDQIFLKSPCKNHLNTETKIANRKKVDHLTEFQDHAYGKSLNTASALIKYDDLKDVGIESQNSHKSHNITKNLQENQKNAYAPQKLDNIQNKDIVIQPGQKEDLDNIPQHNSDETQQLNNKKPMEINKTMGKHQIQYHANEYIKEIQEDTVFTRLAHRNDPEIGHIKTDVQNVQDAKGRTI